MSLVTIGLDFGTSSIKCVVRPFGQPNRDVELIRSPGKRLRWPSLLGCVRTGPDAGRLLYLDDCVAPGDPPSALVEPNLKLALLLEPGSIAAVGLERRWEVPAVIPAVLLLAATVCHASTETRRRWPEAVQHVLIGAPVGPEHPPEQLLRFERAIYAAMLLSAEWKEGPPKRSSEAIPRVVAAWDQAANLPSEEERKTRVIPEAYAALEGVASASGQTLPIGRVCVLDVGGGTTDVAWATHTSAGGYRPIRSVSIDRAGELIDAKLAFEASRSARRAVGREELWRAKLNWSDGRSLDGEGWSLPEPKVRSIMAPIVDEIGQIVQRHGLAIDAQDGQIGSTAFAFVGGATAWAMLRTQLYERVAIPNRSQSISVEGFGLSEDAARLPLAVSLGLSRGMVPLARLVRDWREVEEPAQADSLAVKLVLCPCKGLMFNCARCGGSGLIESETPGRFSSAIDPFGAPANALRCAQCQGYVLASEIVTHLRVVHDLELPVPAASPAIVKQCEKVLLRKEAIVRALQGHRDPAPTDAELVVASEVVWLWQGILKGDDSASASARRFLSESVKWCDACPWLHLPRTMAFAAMGEGPDARRSAEHALMASVASPEQIQQYLVLDGPERAAVLWESILQ
jgi:hypothetical protein